MKATIQTQQQVERFVRKVIEKFPADDERALLTDIHIRVNQDTGEMLAFNDHEEEITRCVVEQWIADTADNFYSLVTHTLQDTLAQQSERIDKCGILKPFSFVLETEEGEHVAELYVADDDTIIVGDAIMKNLNSELDSFIDDILQTKD